MFTSVKTVFILSALAGCSAFAPSIVSSSIIKTASSAGSLHSDRAASLFAYVPDGLTPEQYQRIKKEEQQKLKGKDLARLGPRGFKSRSMEAWQKAYERGLASHSIAPFGYKEALKKKEIRLEDVPYMVRGGSWDNSDVKGAKKRLRWLKQDKEYANGGYRKEQSASILGSGPGFDWTGTRIREDNLRKIVPGLS